MHSEKLTRHQRLNKGIILERISTYIIELEFLEYFFADLLNHAEYKLQTHLTKQQGNNHK